jgi:hypothetical protein
LGNREKSGNFVAALFFFSIYGTVTAGSFHIRVSFHTKEIFNEKRITRTWLFFGSIFPSTHHFLLSPFAERKDDG